MSILQNSANVSPSLIFWVPDLQNIGLGFMCPTVPKGFTFIWWRISGFCTMWLSCLNNVLMLLSFLTRRLSNCVFKGIEAVMLLVPSVFQNPGNPKCLYNLIWPWNVGFWKAVRLLQNQSKMFLKSSWMRHWTVSDAGWVLWVCIWDSDGPQRGREGALIFWVVWSCRAHPVPYVHLSEQQMAGVRCCECNPLPVHDYVPTQAISQPTLIPLPRQRSNRRLTHSAAALTVK